jgi:predicted O-methyltransferase YrrM
MTLTHNMRHEQSALGLNHLCEYVHSIIGDNLKIIEIGSYCGASTEIIANKFITSQINCVDPWAKYVEDCSSYNLDAQELELKEAEIIFDKIKAKYPNINKNKMQSNEYVKYINNKSIDFIYIDGNHQYSSVKEDISIWIPKIKDGGFLSGHDYDWPSVKKAVIDILNKEPDKTFCDNSWVYRL